MKKDEESKMIDKNKTTVVFHWSNPPSLNTPKAIKKLLGRWQNTCKGFKVYNLIVITNNPNVKLGDTEINFTRVKTLEEALKDRKNIVYIEQGGTPLQEFKHPKNATYVFGADYSGGLQVDNAISINSEIALHAEVACGIVLHDRFNPCPTR